MPSDSITAAFSSRDVDKSAERAFDFDSEALRRKTSRSMRSVTQLLSPSQQSHDERRQKQQQQQQLDRDSGESKIGSLLHGFASKVKGNAASSSSEGAADHVPPAASNRAESAGGGGAAGSHAQSAFGAIRGLLAKAADLANMSSSSSASRSSSASPAPTRSSLVISGPIHLANEQSPTYPLAAEAAMPSTDSDADPVVGALSEYFDTSASISDTSAARRPERKVAGPRDIPAQRRSDPAPSAEANTSSSSSFSPGRSSTPAGWPETILEEEEDCYLDDTDDDDEEYVWQDDGAEPSGLSKDSMSSFGLSAAATESKNVDLVEPSDPETEEAMMRMLAEVESGFTIMLDRIKENMLSCKDAAAFLRKRASMEEDYGRSMVKLVHSYSRRKGRKEGSYNESWRRMLRVHERVGEARIKYGQNVAAVATELSRLHKSTARSRKRTKDAGQKLWKVVQDSVGSLEKAKSKYESCSEDWERSLINRENSQGDRSGASTPVNGSSSRASDSVLKGLPNAMQIWRNQNPPTPQKTEKLQKMEDDARTKAAVADESYKLQLHTTNGIRQAFYESELPRLLKSLKDANDACDRGIKNQLMLYACEIDTAVRREVETLGVGGRQKQGVVNIVKDMDPKSDFEKYLSCFFQGRRRIDKADFTYCQYTLAPEASAVAFPRLVFGMDLANLCDRDGVSVPTVVPRSIEVIERHGLRMPGLYRLSGSNAAVQRVRAAFDKGADYTILDDYADDVSVITSVLKLFFRELPNPLLPRSMYQDFIAAARMDKQRECVIRTHELINALPDANYATLRVLGAHLWRVHKNSDENKMGIQNLSVVWASSLMDANSVPAGQRDTDEVQLQARVVETIATVARIAAAVTQSLQFREYRVAINEIKKGQLIVHKDRVWVVADYSQHTQGRQGSHYKLDLRDLARGTKIVERFNAGSLLEGVDLHPRSCQFLYADDQDGTLHFLDRETMEEIQTD
ncbi:hypothetical protein HK405_007329, partial [Cladochytrium tenue]